MGWVRKYPKRIFVIVATGLVFLTFWGINAMEVNRVKASKNELFNQLIAIMEENVPGSDTSYNRDITELVCPLVTPIKLNQMIVDEYARERMEYLNYPYTYSGREGDVRWRITINNWKEEGVWFSSTLVLVITINQIDGKCDARIRRYPNTP